MNEVTYMREVWLKRAKVASDCAAELGALKSSLDLVVGRNYFGHGCVEGADLFERLRTLVATCVADLADTRAAADQLSLTAHAAAVEIEAADSDSEAFVW